MSTVCSASETRPITISGRSGMQVTVDAFFVQVVDGKDRGVTARLASTSVRIGTDPSNDLVLSDPAASRRHAMITLTEKGLLVEDLESKNGTWLAGARIRSALIADGTELQVGASVLKVARAPRKIVAMTGDAVLIPGLIGRSAAMQEVFALIEQLARTDLPVAITGETGTGKDLVARALHQAGPRSARAFVVLDCGAASEDLLRSEVFGHEKGAFTGADQVHKGALEQADGGTVMLDEIGELKLAIQPQLLRALEARQVTRLGGSQKIGVDFRLVSATNRDLAASVAEGRFRQDLYYRITCLPIRIPALRERLEDLPLLATHLITECASRNEILVPEITAAAMDALCAHDWPGNVRELKNVVESVCVLSRGNPILPEQVMRLLGRRAQPPTGPALQPAPAPSAAPSPAPGGSAAPETLEDAERAAIERALIATKWNRKAAARRLGISSSTLFVKLRQYGLRPPDEPAP